MTKISPDGEMESLCAVRSSMGEPSTKTTTWLRTAPLVVEDVGPHAGSRREVLVEAGAHGRAVRHVTVGTVDVPPQVLGESNVDHGSVCALVLH